MTISDQKQKEAYLNRAYELGCEDAAYELGNIETDILDTPDYSDYAHYRNYIGDDGEHHRVIGQYGGDSKEGQILVYSKKGSINNDN